MITKAFVDPNCQQHVPCPDCGTPATKVVRVYKDWGHPPFADAPTRFVYRMPCGHCGGVPSQDLTPAEIAVVQLMLEE